MSIPIVQGKPETELADLPMFELWRLLDNLHATTLRIQAELDSRCTPMVLTEDLAQDVEVSK